MTVKEQWPAFTFLVALPVIVSVVLISTGPNACKPEEATATCLREWVSASGNILIFFVGVVAAFVAYRQFKVSERQIAIGRLPLLDAQFSMISTLLSIVSALRFNFSSTKTYLRTVNKLVHSPQSVQGLIMSARQILDLRDASRKHVDEAFALMEKSIFDRQLVDFVDRLNAATVEVVIFGLNANSWLERLCKGDSEWALVTLEIRQTPELIESDIAKINTLNTEILPLMHEIKLVQERLYAEREENLRVRDGRE